MIISLNLELGEIERERIYTSEKTGKKYLALVLIDHRQPDPYGNDGFVAHSLSKAERESGRKSKAVGNWKFIVRPGNGATDKPRPAPPEEGPGDIPF